MIQGWTPQPPRAQGWVKGQATQPGVAWGLHSREALNAESNGPELEPERTGLTGWSPSNSLSGNPEDTVREFLLGGR